MGRCLDDVTCPDPRVATGLRVGLWRMDRDQSWDATEECHMPEHVYGLAAGETSARGIYR